MIIICQFYSELAVKGDFDVKTRDKIPGGKKYDEKLTP